MREIPQLRPEDADSVAHVVDLTTTAGRGTHRRPVRCTIGTMAPGASVTVRTHTRVLTATRVRSIVLATSTTAETNTANNIAIARVRSTDPTSGIDAGVSAPASGRVGTRLRYRVSVTGTGTDGARTVRLCTRPPRALGQVSAPGTFAVGGRRCRDFGRLAEVDGLARTATAPGVDPALSGPGSPTPARPGPCCAGPRRR